MKVMFTFNIDHVIDITTNSSSEMFLFTGKNTDMVHQMVVDVYPEYESEYSKVQAIENLSQEDFRRYFVWNHDNWNWDKQDFNSKKVFGIPNEELYQNLQEKEDQNRYFYPEITTDQEVITRLKRNIVREKGKTYVMFSHNQNPRWDKQEDLIRICTRKIHMG